MLELIECNPSGCFAYGLHSTIALGDLGVTELTGINHDRITKTANGCGKTNLLNTICHILYDQDPSGASNGSMVNNVWDKGMWAYLKYRSPHGLFRVVIARKWTQDYPDIFFNEDPCQLHLQSDRYRGTDLYFDEWNGSMWMDKRGAKSTDTRKSILASLPMSYQQFLTTSYMAQQQGNAFVTGKNKDRMLIISELTDMTIWDRASRVGRDRHTPLVDAHRRLEGKIEGKRAALEALSHELTFGELEAIEIECASLDAQIDEYQDSIILLNNEVTRISDEIGISATRVNDLIADKDRHIQARLEIIGKLNSAKAEMERDIARVQPLPDTETPKLTARGWEITSELGQLKQTHDKLASIGATCDKCGTPQNASNIVQRMSDLTGRITALRTEAEILSIKRDSIKVDIIKILDRERMDITLSYTNRINTMNTARDIHTTSISAADVNLYEINLERAPLEALRRSTISEIEDMNKALATARARRSAAHARRDQNQQIAAARASASKDIDRDVAELGALTQEIAILSVAIKGMSDRGIKAHKFGSIIATLNELVKEYIDVLTDGQVQVWFTPFREKANAKDDSDVVAEVSILVREGPKADVELALYSGAEKQQITLAIICAFWRLASQQGGGSNILFLDEIFGSFDGPTASLAVRLIQKLRESHFGTIVVVTHDDKVKQMLEYDTRWLLEKRHHISTLTVQ